MMIRILRPLGLGVLPALLLVVSAGCQPAGTSQNGADAHGHESEHPETYGAALQNIEESRAAIEKAFNGDAPSDAHGALHEVGHLLDALPEMAAEQGVSDQTRSEIKEHADLAFDAFNRLDAQLHPGGNQEELTYDDVAETIETSLAALRELAPDGDTAHDGEHAAEHDETADHDGESHGTDHDDQASHDQDGEDHTADHSQANDGGRDPDHQQEAGDADEDQDEGQ